MQTTIEPPRQSVPEVGAAQLAWAQTPLPARLRIVRELRRRIAENAETLANAAASVSGRPLAEKLVSEVLPLADACRWLERNAARVLAARRAYRSKCCATPSAWPS